MRLAQIGFGTLLGLAVAGWGAYRLWPRTLEMKPSSLKLTCELLPDRSAVRFPGRFLVARLPAYDDELFAYLMSQHLKGVPALKGTEVLLTYRRVGETLSYPIELLLPDDLTTAIPLMAGAQSSGLIPSFSWRYVDKETLAAFRYQSRVFTTAYNLHSHRKIEDMSREEVAAYMKRFVQFKSTVDPRIRRRIEPVPHALTSHEAHRMAMDIVTIADFYDIPVDFFVGIGAIENNYMNVMGDLEHAVWKKRAEPGDIVLKRRKGRVLVRNQALGPWQITRETLRRLHKLYLTECRDYSRLPDHLQPPLELNLDDVNPDVLTTYAGLYFRQMLDRFEGDVRSAVGAYNGGPGNPNFDYEAGVRVAADHARRTIQQAAALNGAPAAGMRFLRPHGPNFAHLPGNQRSSPLSGQPPSLAPVPPQSRLATQPGTSIAPATVVPPDRALPRSPRAGSAPAPAVL
jgi:hypothetical protein